MFTACLVRFSRRYAPLCSEYRGKMVLHAGESPLAACYYRELGQIPCPADVSAPSNMNSDGPNALRVAAGYRRSKEAGKSGGSSTKLWGQWRAKRAMPAMWSYLWRYRIACVSRRGLPLRGERKVW